MATPGAIPDMRRILLSRERVLTLDQGLPVLVVEAPSGYGKTVLAEMWLDRHRKTASCTWVTLDASSSDPVVFLEQLLEAVGAHYPGHMDSAIEDDAGRAERFAHLCNELRETDSDICLVIDDAHVLGGSSSGIYLEKFLQLASPRLRICLTLQPAKLEVGLGRLTAQGFVSWIPPQSLALTREEIAAFGQLRGQTLSPSQLDWLWQATEGWPVFVQLAMAMPLAATPGMTVANSGAMRAYICERFVDGLSSDARDVLWMLVCVGSAPISLLNELDSSSAKVELALHHFRSLGIVQNRDPDDSSAVCLHALIREGASALLDRAGLRRRHELIRGAAEWYWRNGLGSAAVRQALQGGAAMMGVARDWLVSLGFGLVFRSGQHQTLLDLIEQWERLSGQTDARMDEAAGWALTFQRQFNAALDRIDRLGASPKADDHPIALLQKAVLVSLRDDHLQGGALSDAWIRQHPGVHTFQMGVASTVHAFSLKCSGDSEPAQAALHEALHCFNAAQSAYGVGWVHVVGSLVLVQMGRYRAALAQVEGGLLRCPDAQGFGSLRSLLRAIEAFLRYERNELAAVRDILSDILGLLPEQGIVDAISLGYTAAARASAAGGDFGTALDLLSEGEELGARREYPRLSFILRTERALLFLRGGSTTQARRIIKSIPAHEATRTTIQLLQARLMIAEGDPNTALERLHAIRDRLRASFRQSRLCEVMIQIALAEDARGNAPGALSAIGEALEIGSAEGYLRAFVDEGQPLRPLVERWAQRNGGRAALSPHTLATTVLGHVAATEASKPVSVSLTKRERQILALVNEGLSNAQVASRCFLSAGTVKWYLHHLYEKFYVNNRTALLHAVREQGIKL